MIAGRDFIYFKTTLSYLEQQLYILREISFGCCNGELINCYWNKEKNVSKVRTCVNVWIKCTQKNLFLIDIMRVQGAKTYAAVFCKITQERNKNV